MTLSPSAKILREFFMHLTVGNADEAASGCVGFEIGLELAMTHPEYARAFYLTLKGEDEKGWVDPEHMAAGLVEVFPIQILDEVGL